MTTLDRLRERVSRIYRLMQKARTERRRVRLRQLYERNYDVYRKQKLIVESLNRLQFR